MAHIDPMLLGVIGKASATAIIAAVPALAAFEELIRREAVAGALRELRQQPDPQSELVEMQSLPD